MNWHGILEVNGQRVPVEPVAGALVEHVVDGVSSGWGVAIDDDDFCRRCDEQDTIYPQQAVAANLDYFIPILPAVPPGLTCWDVFAAVRDDDLRRRYPDDPDMHRRDTSYTRYWPLEDIVITWHNRRDNRFNDYWQPIWSPAGLGDDFAPDAPPRNRVETYPAHMRDMQKYGALLDWIKANTKEQ